MPTIKTKPPAIWLDNFLEETAAKIVVANQLPAPDDLHHPVLDPFTFSVMDLGPGTNEPSSVLVYVGGALAYDGASFVPPYHIGSSVSKKSSPGSGVNDIWDFAIRQAGGFASETLIEIRVEAESTGLYSSITNWSFTTADITAPEVDSVVATSPRHVEVRFNEGVDSSTVIAAAFGLTSDDPPYYLPEIEEIEELKPYRYRIKFTQELSNAKEYSLAVQDVEDLAVPPNTIVPTVIDFTSAAYPAPEDRKWDLWSMVPSAIRWADRKLTGGSPGHTERFIQILQEIVDLWLLDVDTDAYVLDVDKAPEGAIDLLLSFFRNPFPFALTGIQKRKLARMLWQINASKHKQGLIDVVFFFMGINITITPLGYGGGGWRLAKTGLPSWRLPMYGKLGVSTRLLGSPGESWPYTFIVNVPVALSDNERQQLIQIIEVMKNSHEHYTIQEPTPPPLDTWRLGVPGYTELGITTRLGS